MSKNLKGFTLLEVIVAISIITIGIIGIFSLITQTMSNSTFSREEMTAAYLAQEGIEIVRNIRDSNLVNKKEWDYLLNEEPAGYQASYSSGSLEKCSATGCVDMGIGPDGFYY